jgi:L-aminopeptidase/D-esterase-like protein
VITDVGGVRVGHWTDAEARTGCTVALFPTGTVASAEVRGGAPATRELDLLAPERLVDRIDAVLLTGGSAFGLAAADGVMRFCEARGIGYPTRAGPVPIVPALALYDLGVGDPSVRPGPEEGHAAAAAATGGRVPLGAVGAGAGATVDKWRGPEHTRPGGLVSSTVRRDGVVVAALLAVNAFGGLGATGAELAEVAEVDEIGSEAPFGHTTIGVVATNTRLDKTGCVLVARSGQDGLARALVPSHTRFDGDALIAAATGEVDGDLDRVRVMATIAVERAVASVVGP